MKQQKVVNIGTNHVTYVVLIKIQRNPMTATLFVESFQCGINPINDRYLLGGM